MLADEAQILPGLELQMSRRVREHEELIGEGAVRLDEEWDESHLIDYLDFRDGRLVFDDLGVEALDQGELPAAGLDQEGRRSAAVPENLLIVTLAFPQSR